MRLGLIFSCSMHFKKLDHQSSEEENTGLFQAILKGRLFSALLLAGSVAVAGVILNRPSVEMGRRESVESEMRLVRDKPNDPVVLTAPKLRNSNSQGGKESSFRPVQEDMGQNALEKEGLGRGQSEIASSLLEISYEEIDQSMVDLGFYDIDAFPEFMLAFANLQAAIREGKTEGIHEKAEKMLEANEQLETQEAIWGFQKIKAGVKGDPEKMERLRKSQGCFKSILNHAEFLVEIGKGDAVDKNKRLP